MGAARAIPQALKPFGGEPADPLVARGRRAPLSLSRHGNRPATFEDPLHQQLPTVDGELRPRMCHESLLARGLDPVERGGSHFLNNVLGNYS